jgi:hypothetical protein
MKSGPAAQLDVMAEVSKHLEAGTWRLTGHAIKRMDERHLTVPEVEFVLARGYHEAAKDKDTEKGRTYHVRGHTKDGKELRIALGVRGWMLIVTVVDLDASPDRS